MAHIYTEEIPRRYDVVYIAAIVYSFFSMHPNARSHASRLQENMVKFEIIQSMENPTNSTNMNPIENVWDTLGRYIATRLRYHFIARHLDIAVL